MRVTAILSLLLAIIATFALSLQLNDNSLFFLFSIYLFLGLTLSFKKDKNLIYIFLIAFASRYLYIYISTEYYISTSGTLFAPGGDERTFWDWVMMSITSQSAFEGIAQHGIRYIGFIRINQQIHNLLTDLGFQNVTSLIIKFTNAFVGSFIPVVIYLTGLRLYSKKIAVTSAILVAIYPFSVSLTASGLRDVYAYLSFSAVALITVSEMKNLTRLLLLGLICGFTLTIRAEVTAYEFFLILCYYLLKNKISVVYAGALLLVMGLGLFAFRGTGQVFLQSIQDYSTAYDNLRESKEAVSLASKLKNSGVAGKIGAIPYVWLSPLPPPAVLTPNILTIYISIGCLFWYVMFTYFIVRVRKLITSKFEYSKSTNLGIAYIYTAFIGTVIISFTSADARHIQTFYPLAMLIGYAEYASWEVSRRRKIVIRYIFGFIPLVILLYTIVKFL